MQQSVSEPFYEPFKRLLQQSDLTQTSTSENHCHVLNAFVILKNDNQYHSC